jgi:serine/threonine protein kinase
MANCRKCHHDVVPGARFCAHCGASTVSTPAMGPPTDPFLGRTLKGVYFIQQKIGDGGMGLVYKAVHVELDAPFAVKILRGSLLSDPGVVGRFQREARAASRLHHPNVVAVTDFGQTEDGVLFMVMEHVTGKNLARVIADEAPISERRVVFIGAQILSALAEAHASQILHRDLKPENVMVETRRDTSDSIKVLDFGIAKVLMAGSPATTLTRAGLVVGTPGYMSPEQLTGDDLDPRSDLYSVGVVLYEMLTGKLPHAAKTPIHMARLLATEPPPPPSGSRPTPVSRELEALVMRALAPRREDRPGSAEEMREQLLACPVEGGATRSTPAAALPTVVAPRTGDGALPAEALLAVPGRPSGEIDSADGRSELLERLGHTPVSGRPTSTPGQASTARDPIGPGTRLDPVLLEAVEKRALLLLGPVAPYLLRKARATASTVQELVQNLAAFVPSEKERDALFAAFDATRTSPGPAPASTPARVEWDPAVLDRIQRRLAMYIGPVARVVVQRASARAGTSPELLEMVSREIANGGDRARFLESLGAPDGAGPR